jgi:hypothetical protein
VVIIRWDVKGADARVEKGLQSEEGPGHPEGYPGPVGYPWPETLPDSALGELSHLIGYRDDAYAAVGHCLTHLVLHGVLL